MKIRNQRGDTIVEVLIAIGIIAVVLGGAYIATNRALRQGRAAQERSEALEVAREQLERIRYIVTDSVGTDIYTGTPTFCIASDLSLVTVSNVADPSGYNAACRPDPTSRYAASVERTGSGSSLVFTVRVLWENVTGSTSTVGATSLPGYDEVTLEYRIL